MSEPENSEYISPEEYLRSEELSPVRREYMNGQLFLMTGSTLNHNQIIRNLQSVIKVHMKGSDCRLFMMDIKVHVEQRNSFYYPDLVVTCSRVDMTKVFVSDPVLIIEVLSPSTAAIDRREKLSAYQQIPRLQEYALVYQSMKRVDVFSRASDLRSAKVYSDSDLVLNSLPNGPLTISLADIYAETGYGEPEGKADPWRVSELVGELAW
jgi:Uma2 family endonuclease